MRKEQFRTAGGVTYLLVRRSVKNINLHVRKDGIATVSASPRVPAETVDAFVAAHGDWIAAARARLQARAEQQAAQPLPDPGRTLDRFTAMTRQAMVLFPTVLGGKTPLVKVRDMSTRWGVCHMAKGTITYALRLANMPIEAQEYVVIHELCHFLVPNHSPAFWAQVEARLPDWKARRKMLRG